MLDKTKQSDLGERMVRRYHRWFAVCAEPVEALMTCLRAVTVR
jgi:hypothetical protein